MMLTKELNFNFKGARDYINGTDILNASTRFLLDATGGVLEGVEFVIHRMTNSNLLLQLYNPDEVPRIDQSVVATFKFLSNEKRWDAHLTETGHIPSMRTPYDESLVVEQCKIDVEAKSACLHVEKLPYTAIETLVSMNKSLHLMLFPGLDKQWVFCRWDSPVWPIENNLQGVCITLKQALGTRLTKAEVAINGQVLGYIYFSARAK